MTRRLLFLALLLFGGMPANAEHPAECRVAENLTVPNCRLPRVAKALAEKRLNILVLGAGSSQLPGSNGAKNAYPARLQQALAQKLPGVDIKITTDVKSRRTAVEMVKILPNDLGAAKPDLLIWQTGTVDAMLAVDPDVFSQALDKGINIAQSEGADVVLINSQYSPRTEWT